MWIGREHPLLVGDEVVRLQEQVLLRDVRRVDVGVAGGDVAPAARAAPSPAAHDAAARVPHRQAGSDLLREREQVELLAELAVVALGGLLEALLVRAQLVLGRPGGAVDALQLRVLLAAAPVGAGDAGERPAVADQAGARQVRAAAEVLPDGLAVAVDVVVDRQLAAADLDRGALSRPRSLSREGPFRPMSSSLNGSSTSSARASSSVTTRRTNRWPSRTMRCISFVDGLEILRA